MTSDPSMLMARASDLFRTGPATEAIAAYRALLEVRPDLPNSWFNLAMLERRARRFEPALACYARALALGVEQPEEAHLRRAAILSDDLGRSEDARAELLHALKLAPAYVDAWLNLGNLHEDCGERREADAAYRRVLALEPEHPLALARLSGLIEPEDVPPLLDRLRSAVGAPASSAQDRADLGFALAHVLDRSGAYDEAFAASVAANQASRQIAARSGVRYDATAEAAYIDRLIAAFPRPAVRTSDDREAPLFVCGMFRSGSTLAEQILACHPAITAGGELGSVPALIAELDPYPEAATALSPEKRLDLRRRYLDDTHRRHPAGVRLIDKRPDNFLHIGFIKMIFPGARFVHTSRDALDNGLSIFLLHLDPAMLPYSTDLADIGHYRCLHDRLMAHWQRLYPDDIFELDYDRLVAEPRSVVQSLLRFCGLEWREEVMSFHRARGAVRTPSQWQVREPLFRHASGRAGNYARHLAPLQTALDACGKTTAPDRIGAPIA